jgi:hypothetical protein
LFEIFCRVELPAPAFTGFELNQVQVDCVGDQPLGTRE